MEMDNYIIEDAETDTIQTQEGLAGAYQNQESANTSEQSRTSNLGMIMNLIN